MIRAYIGLTKPGIIMGNVITAVAGFLLASHGKIDLWLLLVTLAALALIIAAACVFNNAIDRFADQKMARTQKRALATGAIPLRHAMLFAALLSGAGIAIFAAYDNLLTLLLALIGIFVYVLLYSVWKYRTAVATLIGSIAGAVPPVVGYCAVTGRFDMTAALLFAIVALWQMPHFFAIALYRQKEYAAAAIPVLPVSRGVAATKIQMLSYTTAFALVAPLPSLFGYTGYIYFTVALLLGLAWLGLCIQGFWRSDDVKWARQMFLFSLVVITTLSLVLAIDGV